MFTVGFNSGRDHNGNIAEAKAVTSPSHDQLICNSEMIALRIVSSAALETISPTGAILVSSRDRANRLLKGIFNSNKRRS